MLEIPDLKDIEKRILKDKLAIISFVKTTRVNLARKIIVEKEMHWPQILLTEQGDVLFKIQAYPTNILILPDGKTCIRFNAVNHILISSFIK